MGEPAATADRTFTEGEAYALVADNVARETATLKADAEKLTTEKAALQTAHDELQTKLDVAEAARETADKALTDYKAEVEAEKASAERETERVAKVREVAKHLKDEFYTAERAKRWGAMDDEAFTAYVAELAEVSAGKTETTTSTKDDKAPRETAMAGSQVRAPEGKGGGLAAFFNVPTGGTR